MSSPPIRLNYVVALPCEARPLIDRFRLHRRTDRDGVALYEREHIRLIVTGIGRLASAAGVGFLAGSAPAGPPQTWINVGIAGHASRAYGEIALAHRIDDRATGAKFYPAILFSPPCPSARVTCFDRPTTVYDGDAYCDMESAGFYASALRHSSIEFVHVLKIVSDNNPDDLRRLDRNGITALIAAHMDVIETIANSLSDLGMATFPDAETMPLDDVFLQWHFSHTQRTRLRALARRWAVLEPATSWPPPELGECRDAGAVLSALELALDATELTMQPRVRP